MKKFNFNLESILRYRENAEKYEKDVLTGMNGELAQLLAQLNHLQTLYANEIRDFESRSLNGISVQELMFSQAVIRNLEINIQQKNDDIENQRKIIAEQTEVVVTASRERKSIEKLKVKERKKYDKAVVKENELLIEEFVSIRKAAESAAQTL